MSGGDGFESNDLESYSLESIRKSNKTRIVEIGSVIYE